MGNIRKKLTDSQPKPYFYFCHLCRTNIAKSSLIHWSNIFFQSNLRQMKVVLFPCRSWQSVTQLLSSTNGWAKSGCSLFLSCSFLFPFLVLYSKCAIIPINSQQQTCFLACKTSKFQHATIPYCNRNKYTFFFFGPTRNKCTSTHEHEPADKKTNMGCGGKGHTAVDLTTAQLLSSIPGKSPVVSSREKCLGVVLGTCIHRHRQTWNCVPLVFWLFPPQTQPSSR